MERRPADGVPRRRDFPPWSWFLHRPTPNLTLVPSWAPPLVVIDLAGPLAPSEWRREGVESLLRELKRERVQVVFRGAEDHGALRRRVDRIVDGGISWHSERGWSCAPPALGAGPGLLRDGDQCTLLIAPDDAIRWPARFPDAAVGAESLWRARSPGAWTLNTRDPLRAWLLDIGYHITDAELYVASAAIRMNAERVAARWLGKADDRGRLEWERVERAIRFGRVASGHPLMKELEAIWEQGRFQTGWWPHRLLTTNPRLSEQAVRRLCERASTWSSVEEIRRLVFHPRHSASSWGRLCRATRSPVTDAALTVLPAAVAGHARWRRRMFTAAAMVEADPDRSPGPVEAFLTRTDVFCVQAKAPELLVLLAAHSESAMVFLLELPDDALPPVPLAVLDRMLGSESGLVRRVGIELARRRAMRPHAQADQRREGEES